MVMFYWFSTFCHKSLNFFTYIQYNYGLSQRKEFSYSQINDYVTTEVRTSTSAEIGWVEQYFHELFQAKKLYNLVYVIILSEDNFPTRINLSIYSFAVYWLGSIYYSTASADFCVRFWLQHTNHEQSKHVMFILLVYFLQCWESSLRHLHAHHFQEQLFLVNFSLYGMLST